MFVIKRNQIIITALVVMIAAAGYLNYIDSTPAEPSEVVVNDEGDIMGIVPDGELAAVSGDGGYDEISLIGENENETNTSDKSAEYDNDEFSAETGNDDAGTAVFVNTSNDSSYFIQAKLDREQSRAKQKDILTEMINNDNIEQDKKSECANAMLEIQQRIEKETAAEAMIEAKGFDEVYVRIDDETVDVVVNKETLTDAEIAQIEDIIKRKTGVTADKIRINPMKKN